MTTREIATGVVHDVPDDLREMLLADDKAYSTWQDITSLARNEWICWITSAKKDDTRQRRLRIAGENLGDGKRRPCCWPGCPHR